MTIVEEVRAARSLPKPQIARAIREAAGVSQTRLAAEIGVARNTVARWERGERRPRPAHRARYATLLAELREVA